MQIGPYEVVRELGRGGMGVVYEVRHPAVPRRLALKLISSDVADAEALERFLREARLLAKVSHPNVLAIHAIGRGEDGRPWFVTDLVEGESLKAVARRSAVEPERAARIVGALCGAVGAIHAQGILHRDLKPENVILQSNDTPVLLDFGLAREADARSLTQSGAILGTPAYMSPEQASGESTAGLDARTDVYGLGAILFELLAGRAPFDGTPIQILTAVCSKEPRWPSDGRAAVPRPLEYVLRKAMTKDRDQRYSTAAGLGRDLDRFLDGSLVVPTGSRRGVFAIAAVAVVAIAAAGFALFPKHADPPPKPPVPEPSVVPEPPKTPPKDHKPTFDPGNAVPTYLAIVRWLREKGEDPDVRNELEKARFHGRLDRVLLSKGKEGAVWVRFASPTHLAVSSLRPEIDVIDLDKPLAATSKWTKWPLKYRANSLAVRPGKPCDFVWADDIAIHRAQWSKETGPIGDIVTLYEHAIEDRAFYDVVAISPTGDRAAVAGTYRTGRVVRLDGSESRDFGDFPRTVYALSFNDDGSRILSGTMQTPPPNVEPGLLGIWSSDTGKSAGPTRELRGSIYFIPFGPDRKTFVLAVTTGGLYMSEGSVDDLQVRNHVDPMDSARAQRSVRALAFAPGTWIAYGSNGNHTVLTKMDLDPSKGPHDDPKANQIKLDQTEVNTIDVSPDGSLIAIGGCVKTKDDRGDQFVEFWPAPGVP